MRGVKIRGTLFEQVADVHVDVEARPVDVLGIALNLPRGQHRVVLLCVAAELLIGFY